MSCAEGRPCEEGLRRRRALLVLGLMGLGFIGLSAASFLDSRGQAVPSEVKYAGHDAVQGKRVFQTFNCMGCHTIVGNGGYFGPDLTKLYGKVGPAWIEAFLPSPGTWPTSVAVRVQLQDAGVAAEAGVDTIEKYLEKYPAAAERIHRRGGHASMMPTLPLGQGDVDSLIAFLKYTSEMNTEGWPPVPQVDGLTFAQPAPVSAAAAAPAAAVVVGAADESKSDIARGEALAKENGCTACHATDEKRLVGPGWGGLYGNDVTLKDGSTARADAAYLTESILQPNSKIVSGYPDGMMPSYEGILEAGDVAAIVSYIRTLGDDEQ